MNLFSYFKRKTNSPESDKLVKIDTDSLFFHEDDFCQIELLPDNNFDKITTEFEKIREFSDKHSDGLGYTDMYIRNEQNHPLREKQIKPGELIEILDELKSLKHTKVYTGYGASYREISENTSGYGKKYSAIYFNYKDDIVQNIWITNPMNLKDDKLDEILNIIGMRWNLILVDWNLDVTVNLTDIDAINEYLMNEE